MKTSTSPKYFRDQIQTSFCAACDEAADRLWEIMCNQLKRNKAQDEGACQTQETIKPAIRIELNERGAIKVRTSFECLEKYRDNVIDEREFDPEAAMQPDLGLKDGEEAVETDSAPEITRESFYKRVCDADLTEQDLDQYFAQSECGDFETWLTTGTNRAKAIEILDDSDAWDNFRTLVMETLDAMENDEEAAQ